MHKVGFIFDLDGVIVDTAKYHYLAWKKLANELGFEFTIEENELFPQFPLEIHMRQTPALS